MPVIHALVYMKTVCPQRKSLSCTFSCHHKHRPEPNPHPKVMHLKYVGLARTREVWNLGNNSFLIFWEFFSVMSKHKRSKREICGGFWCSSGPKYPCVSLSFYFSLSAVSSHPLSHMGHLRVATEMELDRATLFSATRESFVWAKVLLVFCGKDFRSPTVSEYWRNLLQPLLHICNSKALSMVPPQVSLSFLRLLRKRGKNKSFEVPYLK